jgi:hypothetical protein
MSGLTYLAWIYFEQNGQKLDFIEKTLVQIPR